MKVSNQDHNVKLYTLKINSVKTDAPDIQSDYRKITDIETCFISFHFIIWYFYLFCQVHLKDKPLTIIAEKKLKELHP